jgi:hypothetical protein
MFPVSDALAANPTFQSTQVNARVLIPQTTNVYHNITPYTEACNYYNANDPAGTWNGKYTSQGNRLTNAETQNLTFPLPTYLFIYNDVLYVVNATAADVDRYYDKEKYPTTSGYTRIATAYLSENCHGYSSGLGYWMDSPITLVTDDYTASTDPSQLAAV